MDKKNIPKHSQISYQIEITQGNWQNNRLNKNPLLSEEAKTQFGIDLFIFNRKQYLIHLKLRIIQ